MIVFCIGGWESRCLVFWVCGVIDLVSREVREGSICLLYMESVLYIIGVFRGSL